MEIRKNTVWMLTSGEYSDYGVVGIFSTHTKAREYIEAFPDASYHEPYEIEIDEADTSFHKSGRTVFYVGMERDGTIYQIHKDDNRFCETCESRHYMRTKPHDSSKKYLEVYCWAESEQHAVKIANEIRTQRIASKQWK